MEWKVSFFVETAERTSSGWHIAGEPGIGRPEPGDQFEVVVNEAQGREDPVSLVVEACSDEELDVSGESVVAIVSGDILVGLATR